MRAARPPVAWTMEYLHVAKDKKAPQGPEVSLDLGDWTVGVTPRPQDGISSVSLVPAEELQHWADRP
eukprot:9151733-Lingulodinium_polyedra.AAC.1